MTCTGNCNQGRDCDCACDLDWPTASGWMLIAIGSLSAGCVLGWTMIELARLVFP